MGNYALWKQQFACKVQTVFAFTALKSNIQTSFHSSVFPTLTVFKWITTFSEDFPTSVNNSGYKMSEDDSNFQQPKITDSGVYISQASSAGVFPALRNFWCAP